ncbi:hypothetical protein GT370_00605 [Acidocella sp. MX-AZ03]|uniref:hypothetical protein n=1 Tax=Acidocella sp. MX-AZ03 TaxID=2697363 RepID=UPI0022DCFF7B|nr:hypothetical protein [Acidocella sp. MX-AZ03]WBO59485.1 hypothetical protein GT370_00605 [Acidocella sp. MX-AZ03]
MDIPAHIQGLIFDCDGTLVDTPPLYAAAWMAALAEFGARLELEWFRPAPASPRTCCWTMWSGISAPPCRAKTWQG